MNQLMDAPNTRVLSEDDLVSQPPGFPFIDLPKELRLMVYDVVATHAIRRPLLTPRHSLYYDVPDVGLLRTSRWIRDEAFTILNRGKRPIPTFTVQQSPCNNWFDLREAIKNATCVLERLRAERCASCHEKDDKLVSCLRVREHPTLTETAIIDFVDHPLPRLVCTESTINRFYHCTFTALRRGKPLPLQVVLPHIEHRYRSGEGQQLSSFIHKMEGLQAFVYGRRMRLVDLVFFVYADSAETWAENLSAPGMSPERRSNDTWLVTHHLWTPGFVTLKLVERTDFS